MRLSHPVLLLVIAALSACTTAPVSRTPAPAPPASPTYPNPNSLDIPCMQTSHGCIALNPDVTQESIDQTICVSGYTKSVRPGTAYTDGVKRKLLRERGEGPEHLADYELDHRIPLALGGHPRKLSNLMLQPWDGEDSAKIKDRLEVQLQRKVCHGEWDLADAQHCIAENWQACAVTVAAGRQPTGGTTVTSTGATTPAPMTSSTSSPGTSILSRITTLPEGTKTTICRIKGNISKHGRVYHVPGSSSYDQIQIDESKGERWFCTEEEARAAGWRAPPR
jgi:hypothetical protein